MDHSPAEETHLGLSIEPVHQSRILASTSGNAQVFSRNSKVSCDFDKSNQNSTHVKVEPQRPSPLPILGSNDRAAPFDRLAVRKAKRQGLLDQELRYLQTEQYKAYKGRKRQDIGKDGKPVWSDHIEESFQNALLHIRPMGRRKKPQYGRLHGRNELIAEWIMQDTGEHRDRKQISSHIQVLNKHLKQVPEWKYLTTVQDDDNEYEHGGSEHAYYYESIADAVRLRRELRQAASDNSAGDSWQNSSHLRFSLSNLAFELWVGTPGYITQALHNYTRVPNNHAPSPAVPLEDFDNWRDLFPMLERMLGADVGRECDIILVRSSFALMSDFPPKDSKLGLVLDLDFRSPDLDNFKALGEMKHWSSINNMYLHGQPLRRTEHKDCQSAEFGLVKPFFEADWWAAEFTKLTHKRKEAEEGMQGYTQATADDYSRNLFRGLSIMQEVFASPSPADNPVHPRKRMAVLLWVFSQANKGQAGVSTWQRVIPPPSRIGKNNPLAPTDTVGPPLPPLVLDSMVESSFDSTMTDNDFSLDETQRSTPLSPAIYEQQSYHSGFTPLHTVSHDHLNKFYDFTSTGLTPRFGIFTDPKDNTFNSEVPVALVPALHHGQQTSIYQQVPNVFDHLGGAGSIVAETFSVPQVHHSHTLIDESPPDRRQCLANFDVSTHQMLQTQLSSVQPDSVYSSPEDYDMGEPESQESVVNHMNNLELQMAGGSQTIENECDTMSNEQMALCHPSAFESPRIARPPLLPHNSFAGVLTTVSEERQTEHEHLSFDTPTRDDFARLMENHYASVSEDVANWGYHRDQLERPDFVDGDNVVRPRSQPVLRSCVSPVAPCNLEVVLDSADDRSPTHMDHERDTSQSLDVTSRSPVSHERAITSSEHKE